VRIFRGSRFAVRGSRFAVRGSRFANPASGIDSPLVTVELHVPTAQGEESEIRRSEEEQALAFSFDSSILRIFDAAVSPCSATVNQTG
jgi:hypothetical protein